MNAKLKKELEGRSNTELHAALEGARGGLDLNPNDDEKKELIVFIEETLVARRVAAGDDGDDKVRVKAKDRTPIDHIVLEKGQEGVITKRQYRALAWRLELLPLLLALGVLAGLMLGAPQARAQQYAYSAISSNSLTPINGGTNVVASNTTNTYNFPVTYTRNGELGLVMTFKLTTTGTSNVVATIDKSLDNTNWIAATVLQIAANGTTSVSVGTNIDTGAFGYWRLGGVQNTNNVSAVTNLLILRSVKPSRFDGFQ